MLVTGVEAGSLEGEAQQLEKVKRSSKDGNELFVNELRLFVNEERAAG
jgi:hypothetical protein